MEDINAAVRKESAIRGVLFGVIMLVVELLKMFVFVDWVPSPLIAFSILYPIPYIVLLGLGILFLLSLRKSVGSYWNQRQATTGIFVMLFVMSFIWINGGQVVQKVLVPKQAKKAQLNIVESHKQAMQSANVSKDKIKNEVKSMNETFSAGSSITVASFFKSLFVSIILVFAVSALLGALFKREQTVRTS